MRSYPHYRTCCRPWRRFFLVLLLIAAAAALLAGCVYSLTALPQEEMDSLSAAGQASGAPVITPIWHWDEALPSSGGQDAAGDAEEENTEPTKIAEIPWNLTLVNYDHGLPENFEPNLAQLSNGLLFDARAVDALEAMLSACRAAGLNPIVCSAYRTVEHQTTLFENKVNKYLADGLSYDEAHAAAATIIALPGHSEHNLGLAADICALSYQILDEAQENTPEQQWLMAHCHEYGFILRYPEGKTDITGIIYEPWHYRYVGVELATEIMESGLCLEEYLELYYVVD